MATFPRIRPHLQTQSVTSKWMNSARYFSSSFSVRRHSDGTVSSKLRKNMSDQKSVASYMKTLRRGDLPNDFGLLPQTFIKPERNNLPGFFSSKFRRRLRIEWMALVQRVKDFLALYYLNRWAVKKNLITKKREKLPLFLKGRYSTARRLQKELYSAMAEGNNAELNKVACKGLLRQTRIRLDHRKAAGLPNESWKIEYRGLTPPDGAWWPIQALCPFKSTRIIADRTAELPFGKDNKLRQVVVKIRSRQTLDKRDGKGPISRDVDEYLVIQQITSEGLAEDWMVWGTTKPSTKTQINELLSAPKSSESLWDKMKERMEGVTNSGGPSAM